MSHVFYHVTEIGENLGHFCLKRCHEKKKLGLAKKYCTLLRRSRVTYQESNLHFSSSVLTDGSMTKRWKSLTRKVMCTLVLSVFIDGSMAKRWMSLTRTLICTLVLLSVFTGDSMAKRWKRLRLSLHDPGIAGSIHR